MKGLVVSTCHLREEVLSLEILNAARASYLLSQQLEVELLTAQWGIPLLIRISCGKARARSRAHLWMFQGTLF